MQGYKKTLFVLSDQYNFAKDPIDISTTVYHLFFRHCGVTNANLNHSFARCTRLHFERNFEHAVWYTLRDVLNYMAIKCKRMQSFTNWHYMPVDTNHPPSVFSFPTLPPCSNFSTSSPEPFCKLSFASYRHIHSGPVRGKTQRPKLSWQYFWRVFGIAPSTACLLPQLR